MATDLTETRSFIARVADIDAAWMTRALSRETPGVAVLALERGEIIQGAQTKVRVRVTLNDAGRAAGIPPDLIVKADIDEYGRGPVSAVIFNEPRVYRKIVPETGVAAPRAWATDPGDHGPPFIVMDDLSAQNATFLSLGEPISPDLAADFLNSLARIHARWWDSPELRDDGRFGALRQPMIGMFETYVRSHLAPERFAHFAALPRAAATPRALRDPDQLLAALFRLRDLHRAMPKCVIHGDTHLNNLYVTANGRPGFFDWSPRRTAWSNDVAYFLPAALDVPDRRQHERALIAHYCDRLAVHGGPTIAFEDAWLAYRRELVWGMFVFLINGPTQTEFSNTAAASRFAAAMLDHDTFGLLGV